MLHILFDAARAQALFLSIMLAPALWHLWRDVVEARDYSGSLTKALVDLHLHVPVTLGGIIVAGLVVLSPLMFIDPLLSDALGVPRADADGPAALLAMWTLLVIMTALAYFLGGHWKSDQNQAARARHRTLKIIVAGAMLWHVVAALHYALGF